MSPPSISDHRHPEEWAQISANHALAAHQAIGTLAAEVAAMRQEMHEGFKSMGIKVHNTRRELESLSDEIEDTKTRDLRRELVKHKSRWRHVRQAAIALVVAIVAAVVGAAAKARVH